MGLSNPLKISQSPPLNIVVNSIVLSILTGHQIQIGLDPTLKAEGDFGSCTDCSLLTAPRHPPIHPPTFWVQDPGGSLTGQAFLGTARKASGAFHLSLEKGCSRCAVQGSGLTAPCAVGLRFAFTRPRRVWEALPGSEAAPGHARLLRDLPLWV